MGHRTAHAGTEVSRIMSIDVETCSPDENAQIAATAMARAKVGALIVVDEEQQVLGVLTERDLVSKIMAHNYAAHDILVRDVMSAPAIGVQAEDTLERVLLRMNEFRYRRLPVMQSSQLVGVISQTDILRHYPEMVASHRW